MTETQKSFFSRLNSLGTGERAALRREAGVMLQEADSAALTTFYRCLPPVVDSRQEGKWFAIACLRCLWDPGEENGRPFAQIVADLIRRDELSASTGHRVENLLDTPWDADGYMLTKLARLVKLVKQKSGDVTVDFPDFLDDLLRWNFDSQPVQRKWARMIFANDAITEEKE